MTAPVTIPTDRTDPDGHIRTHPIGTPGAGDGRGERWGRKPSHPSPRQTSQPIGRIYIHLRIRSERPTGTKLTDSGWFVPEMSTSQRLGQRRTGIGTPRTPPLVAVPDRGPFCCVPFSRPFAPPPCALVVCSIGLCSRGSCPMPFLLGESRPSSSPSASLPAEHRYTFPTHTRP